MKINTQDVRRLYQASIADKKPSSRKGCPAPRKIFGLFDGSLSKRHKTRLVDHLTHCGPCCQEFEALHILYQQQETMIDDLTAWAASRDKDKKPGCVADARDAYKPGERSGPPPRLSPRLWAYILGIAGLALCLILAVHHPSVFKDIFGNKYRAAAVLKIELLHPPSPKSVFRKALFFQWKPFPGAQGYFLELFDQALVPLWKSGEDTATKIAPPPEIIQSLQPHRSYYWLVTGILADDKKVESDVGVFSLRGP